MAAELYWSETDQGEPGNPLFRRLPLQPPVRNGLLNLLQKPARKMRQRAISRAWDRDVAPRKATLETFSIAEQFRPTRPDWTAIRADLVHLHWIAFLADWPSFFGSLSSRVPIVWTLHDVNPFTGGCHFTGGCERFRKGCGNCPQLHLPDAKDASHRTFAVKRAAIRSHRIHVVSPSRWIDRLAQSSPVWPDSTTFSVIHYGIPSDVFAPEDKPAAKQGFGIAPDRLVIGFGADNLACERKGFRLLREALRIYSQTPGSLPLTGLLMGGGKTSGNQQRIPGLEETIELGFLGQERDQAGFYSACDLVIVPSLEDNQPQMALEAMSCGTPVVAFEVGGIPEFVRERETGKLVPPGDATELASAIRQLTVDPVLRTGLGRAARKLILDQFPMQGQIEAYQGLYRQLLTAALRPEHPASFGGRRAA